MKLELSKEDLTALIIKQLSALFIFRKNIEFTTLTDSITTALECCEYCFTHTPNKYYRKEGEVYFNPFHSGQYSIFLYFLARAVFDMEKEKSTLPDRIYYLNKCLNGLDLYYEVNMPKIFFLDHPVGSVLGRAVYGERFSFGQNCTVGNNKGAYPTLGNNVSMMSGAKIVGNCVIGDNVIMSANTYIKDRDIPASSMVFGSSPNITIKQNPKEYFAN